MPRSKQVAPEEEPDEELDAEMEELAEEIGEDLTDAIMIGAEAGIIQYEARRYEDVMNSVISVREALDANQDDLDPVIAQILDELTNAIELLATPLASEYADDSGDAVEIE